MPPGGDELIDAETAEELTHTVTEARTR
jgi:hypothetical protein